MKISVILCIYNGSERISKTLTSLSEMNQSPNLEWELIMVDNNSTDNTKEVIQNFAASSNLNVQYCYEIKKGLSHARNRGIQEAKGEIIAFTDDDCIVDPDWLLSINREFVSDPGLTLLGGRVELYNKNDLPVTIRTLKEKIRLSSLDQLFTILPGCNMAFRKEIFHTAGQFDGDLGVGAKIAAGEDTDFFYRVYKKGGTLMYSPDVLVYHNHGRRKKEQVEALKKNYAIGRGGFYCKHAISGDKEMLKFICIESMYRIYVLIRKILSGKSINQDILHSYYMFVGAKYRLTNSLKLN